MARMDSRRMRQNMNSALDGFTTGQKAMMAIAVVGVVLGITLFTRAGSGPSMAPLFSGLDATDASAITSQLDAQGVAYELSDGGRTVLVPQANVYDLRLDMSAQGLPTGGNDGWTLIDGQGITASAFRQRIDFQRALSGELARTIEAIDGVEAAKVNLVIPQNDVFVGDEERSTASVLVMTRSGRTLSEDQVTSIVNLVASAVPSLTPDAVTVADGTGRPLWTPATDGGSAGFAGGSDATRRTMEFETALAKRLEDLVSTITGPGKARVQVKAVLDLDQTATVQEINQAPNAVGEEPLIVNQTENIEIYRNVEPGVGGVLGPDVPDGEEAEDNGGTEYDSTSRQTQFAINRLQEETRKAPGQVARLSVAVAVDAETVDADMAAQIEELVIAAAGLDLAGADNVSVVPIAFDTTAADQATEELEALAAENASGGMTGLIQPVLVGLLVAVVLFMSWRSLKKAAKRAQVNEALDLRELQAVREALQPVPAGAIAVGSGSDDDQPAGLALPAAEESLVPAAVAEPALVLLEPIPMSLAAKTSVQYEAEISEMIDSQSENAAGVIRNWLSESKRTKR